jgi:peptidyl-prolyl cis-trans isomerase C
MKKMIILTTFIFLGCGPKVDESKVVAQVDNIKLTIDELKTLSPGNVIYQLSKEDLEDLLNDWVNTQVFYLEARAKGIDKEDSMRIYLDFLKKTTLAQTFIMREVGKVIISEKDALDYFNKYKDDFLYAVKFLQIITRSELEARQILNEIKSGADFKKLAQTRSLRWVEPRFFQKTDLPPSFAEAIYRLKPREVTQIIKEDITRSYIIGKLLEKKRIKSKVSFAEVSDYIYNLLRFRRQTELYDSLTKELKKKYKIELHLERVK